VQLTVVVPTYNRQILLQRTLDSLCRARIPRELNVRIIVVDNNSKDGTPGVVKRVARRSQFPIDYLFEVRQGRSFALNAGIATVAGDLVATIDDDEEVDDNWYVVLWCAFNRGNLDFIGGPYRPRWGAAVPRWLPRNHLGAIGWVDGGDRMVRYGRDYPGILMGGNAVFTRMILERVGPYSTSLGRVGTRLLSCEDEDFYDRLLAAGAVGFYLPELVIYHYVPPERLTKRYFRDWCFWRGVSRGVMDKNRKSPVPYFGGVPRYLYGEAARSALRMASSVVRDPNRSFAYELPLWDLVGFFYGSHLYKP